MPLRRTVRERRQQRVHLDRQIRQLESLVQVRRTIGIQRNRQEARHRLGRAIFQGRHGELRQHYVAGMEDQLGSLGLVMNAIILWNARYIDLALDHLRSEGFEVREEDVQRLSPLKFEHLHLGGRYHFALTAQVPVGQFRRLRDPAELDG